MLGKKKGRQENLFAPLRRPTRVSRELSSLKQVIDFEWLRKAAREKFAANGRPSIAPEVLGAMLLLGFWFEIPSDRELCEECEDRLSFREFIGLSDEDEVPVHSSLTHWRVRLGRAVFKQFLQETLQAAQRAGLSPGRCRMLDSTLVKAQADLQGDGRVDLDAAVHPDEFLDALGQWEETQLPGEEDKGVPTGPSARSRKRLASGKSMPINAHDVDARVLSHPNKKRDFYHKCHFEFDSKTHLVMNADAGHVFEPVKMVEFLARESYALDTVVADTGYFSLRTEQWLKERGIASYISVRDNSVCGRGFGLAAFHYRVSEDEYVCPEGKVLKRQGTSGKGERRYATARGACVGCALAEYCFQSGRARSRRQLTLAAGRELVEEAKRRHRSPRYHRLRRKRSVVCEGGISQMKRYSGLGGARWLGEDAMAIQALLCAGVHNLKKVLKHLAAEAVWRILRHMRALYDLLKGKIRPTKPIPGRIWS